jgi:hypothetical protein
MCFNDEEEATDMSNTAGDAGTCFEFKADGFTIARQADQCEGTVFIALCPK